MDRSNDTSKTYGIYIHIPYCVRKCSYCGFFSLPLPRASAAERNEVLDSLTESILKEIELYAAAETIDIDQVDTVFFGGGTPSLLPAEHTTRILERLNKAFSISGAAEITLESNPDSLSMDKLKGYKEAGVNRISMGAQSTDEKLLSFLGRVHGRKRIFDAYEEIRTAGFENVNIDLMFGIPGQSEQVWENSLREIIGLEPEHISLYTLQLEEGTPFARDYKNGRFDMPDFAADRLMYHRALELLRAKGYERYEISNAAWAGYECRHNLKYWDMRPFIGLGPGASSFAAGRRYKNALPIGKWQDYIAQGKIPAEGGQLPAPESKKESMSVFCFTSLRKATGISYARFKELFDCDIQSVFGNEIDSLDDYARQGLLIKDENGIRLTTEGMDISNEIMAVFV